MTDTVPIGLIVVRLTQPVKNYPVGTELGYKDVPDAIAALGSAYFFEVVRDQQGNPIPPLTPEEIEAAQRAAQRRAKSRRLILGADFDPLWDRVEGIPDADELEQMRQDVDAVADVPPRVEAVEVKADRADSRVFDVRSFSGAHHQRFAAAIAAASAAGGGEVVAPGSAYDFTDLAAPIRVPAHVRLRGQGGQITVPATINHAVFDIDGASHAQVSGFRIVPASPSAVGNSSVGVLVRGNSDGVILSDLSIAHLMRPVQINGTAGTTPGTVTNCTLDNVTANDSPNSFGIDVLDCDGLHLINCYAFRSWLDGVKLRQKVTNVTILGGRFNHNGLSGGGDGMDAYAGGDTFTIIGTEMSNNNGAGIQFKTGPLNQNDPATNGYVKNAQFIGVRFFNNTGNGLYLTVSEPTVMTQPILSTVVISGGIAEGNGTNGWYLNGRNVTVTGAVAKRNGSTGFLVAARAIETQFTGCLAIANGNGGTSSNGFQIDGGTGSLVNCRAIGVDADTVAVPADLDSLEKKHYQGFFISNAAGDWTIDNCVSTHHIRSSSNGIHVTKTSGVVLINQHGVQTVGAHHLKGSIGSTHIKTNAANTYDVAWIRRSGTPDTNIGWQRISDPPIVTSLPTASAALKGTMLTKDNAGASEDTLHICVQTGASTYAWKQVTLA